jgi:hypothetical protein
MGLLSLWGERRALPEIHKTLLFPSDADFNSISSVWAKCRYSGKQCSIYLIKAYTEVVVTEKWNAEHEELGMINPLLLVFCQWMC